MSAIQRYFSLSQCSLHWPSLLQRFPHSISRTNDKSNASFNAQEQFCLPASNTCHLGRYSGYILTKSYTKTKLLKHTLLTNNFCLPASNTCHLCRYSGYLLTQRLTKTKLLKHTLLSSSQTQSLSISISHVYHLSPCLRQTHVSYLLTPEQNIIREQQVNQDHNLI